MLIDCGLTKKDLKDSRLFCHDGDSETNEEWYERLKQFGFGAGLDDGEEKVHLYYFRWRRKAIYAQRKAGQTFKNIAADHGLSRGRVQQIYTKSHKEFGGRQALI
jgi:DNA-directed RNA polymerase sigma subunit (sigma70/sigma32)